MPSTLVLDLAQDAVFTAFLLGGPILGVALAVGLVVSIIQAVTSIQEQTLSFVPKIFAAGVAFVVLLPWMLRVIVAYASELFRSLPAFGA